MRQPSCFASLQPGQAGELDRRRASVIGSTRGPATRLHAILRYGSALAWAPRGPRAALTHVAALPVEHLDIDCVAALDGQCQLSHVQWMFAEGCIRTGDAGVVLPTQKLTLPSVGCLDLHAATAGSCAMAPKLQAGALLPVLAVTAQHDAVHTL